MDEPMMELPIYRSHKEVFALKIKAVYRGGDDGEQIMIKPEDGRYADFSVDVAYATKHEPKAGGYYVVYQDGYKSWSPAEAFEGGYMAVS